MLTKLSAIPDLHARALALGATAAGIARPTLKALRAGGVEGAEQFLDEVEGELRAVMLLTGSRDVAALRAAPSAVRTPRSRGRAPSSPRFV